MASTSSARSSSSAVMSFFASTIWRIDFPVRTDSLITFPAALVADVRVERRADRRRRLRVLLAARDVGLDAVDALVGEHARDVGQQAQRLEQVAGHHRHVDVELEVALRATERDRGVVAEHLRRDLRDRLGHHRVHLARHDRRSRLQIGDEDLGEPGARTAAHPPDVVGDLHERDRVRAQHARELDERVAGALRGEVVARLGERQAGAGREAADHRTGERLRRVDPGADRGAAQRQLADARAARLRAARSRLRPARRSRRTPGRA